VHYGVCIVVPWLTVGIVGIIGSLANRNPASIGLTLHHLRPNATRLTVLFIVVGTALVLLMTVAIHFAGPKVIQQIRHQMPRFIQSLPHTTGERFTFVLVALTAGICEEILFRGFGIAYIRWLWPSSTRISIVIIIGIAFGLAHYGQGRPTVAFAGIAGGVFGWVTLATGTLVPAIVVHCLVDFRASFFPAELTERPRSKSVDEVQSTKQLYAAEPARVISPSSRTSTVGVVQHVRHPGTRADPEPTDS
jgi:membrane protease YdiL (CAAX protease family)